VARLSVKDLGFGIGGRTLGRGFAIDVDAGDSVGVMAPSGAGKTTLLRTLAGLIDPLAGTMTLDARAPEAWGWPEWRRRVIYVAQRPVIFRGSVLDNVARAFAYRSAGAAFDRSRAERGLERLGLGSHRDTPAERLSAGEQQRVGLLRALELRPSVLLLDEPTSALDVETEALVESMLGELSRNHGAALIVVTHRPEQAGRVAQRVIALGNSASGVEGSQ
jgi:ABC-type multidrug transport system ATPase subunit